MTTVWWSVARYTDRLGSPRRFGSCGTTRRRLAARPVWLFSVGMPGALARPLRRWAMREGPKALAELPDIVRPVDQQLFTGVVLPDQLPLVSRVILRLMGAHAGDFRDWPQIEAWADTIAAHLAEMGTRSG